MQHVALVVLNHEVGALPNEVVSLPIESTGVTEPSTAPVLYVQLLYSLLLVCKVSDCDLLPIG